LQRAQFFKIAYLAFFQGAQLPCSPDAHLERRFPVAEIVFVHLFEDSEQVWGGCLLAGSRRTFVLAGSLQGGGRRRERMIAHRV
jgi:hypothetical protein